MDTLDLLIARALQSRYGRKEPSPRVWWRIRRRTAAITSQSTPVWDAPRPLHLTYRMDIVFPLPFPAAGSLVLWRYDFLLPRLV